MFNRGCTDCGAKCCIAWGADISAIDSDIEKWNKNGAHNISQYVSKKDKSLWIDPNTGARLSTCPFLLNVVGKRTCTIYPQEGELDMRPAICDSYPMGKKCLRELAVDSIYSTDGYELNMSCFKRRSKSVVSV